MGVSLRGRFSNRTSIEQTGLNQLPGRRGMAPSDRFFPLPERLARPPIEQRHVLQNPPASGIEQRRNSIIRLGCERTNQPSQPVASGW